MDDKLHFAIGAAVTCDDGDCGELVRVVVDPVARALTHLVVEPKHRVGLGRLVPITLAGEGSDGIVLHCSHAEFEKLPAAEETEFLPGVGAGSGYSGDQVWAMPYYGLGMGGVGGVGLGGIGAGGMGMYAGGLGVGNGPQPVVRDRVPAGEIEIRRGDQVEATDGAIGKVQGLVVDPADHDVTHVLLQEGHLWGRRQVAIPITAVTSVASGIVLALSKEEVRDLPSVEIERLDVA